MKPHTIRVGKFGTRPVSAYVNKIGIKNIAAIMVNNSEIILKKLIGL